MCAWVEATGATGARAAFVGSGAGAGAGVEGVFAGTAVAIGVGASSLTVNKAETGVVDGLDGSDVDFPEATFADSFPVGATVGADTGSVTGCAADGEGAATGAWADGGGFVVPQPLAARPKAPVINMARKEGRFIGVLGSMVPRIVLSQRLQQFFPSRVKIGLEGGQEVAVDKGTGAQEQDHHG